VTDQALLPAVRPTPVLLLIHTSAFSSPAVDAAMRANPLLLIKQSDADRDESKWIQTFVSSAANWQATCVAIAAVRAHPAIGLSVLALLPAITELACHIPF
jgi:hypothetical protein